VVWAIMDGITDIYTRAMNPTRSRGPSVDH